MNNLRIPGLMPAAGQPSIPDSIRNAVRLMYVGAGLTLLGTLPVLALGDSMRDSIREEVERSSPELDPAMLDAILRFTTLFVVVSVLVSIGLWLWMAYANGKGHSWARTLATVLYAISVGSTLLSMRNVPDIPGGARVMGVLFGFLNLLVGGTIIYLLYRTESNEFFSRGH